MERQHSFPGRAAFGLPVSNCGRISGWPLQKLQGGSHRCSALELASTVQNA